MSIFLGGCLNLALCGQKKGRAECSMKKSAGWHQGQAQDDGQALGWARANEGDLSHTEMAGAHKGVVNRYLRIQL